MGIQIALENKNGGHLIDDLLARMGGATCGIQMTMRLGGAETFIPQNDREFQIFFDGGGELLCRQRARANVAGHVQRQAHHDSRTAMSAHDASQRAHVLAALCTMQRQQGLRGQSHLIGDGHANATIPMIETKNARG